MRVPAIGEVCRLHCRHSNTYRLELSHVDGPEHFGHTKPSCQRLWVRYSSRFAVWRRVDGTRARENVWTLPRPRKSGAIAHPLHLELETA